MKKTYQVPVVWTMCDTLQIEAHTKEDAIAKAQSMELPKGNYLDESFEVDIDEVCETENAVESEAPEGMQNPVKCEFCSTLIEEGDDSPNGTIRGCKTCGDSFCEACFEVEHSAEELHNMVSNDGDRDEILCPRCYAISEMKNPVKCEFCSTWIEWEGSDSQNGTIWGCEICGDSFCEACFEEKHSAEELHNMVSHGGNMDEILCPRCYATSKLPEVTQ